MKVIKFEQFGETVELTVEQQEYLIMAEADVEPRYSMYRAPLNIQMAYDIYDLDNEMLIQDITHQEEEYIYEQINQRYVY